MYASCTNEMNGPILMTVFLMKYSYFNIEKRSNYLENELIQPKRQNEKKDHTPNKDKKFIEEALEQLQRSKQVIKRSLMRNSVVYYLPLMTMLAEESSEPEKVRRMLDSAVMRLRDAQETLERPESEHQQISNTNNCLINTC